MRLHVSIINLYICILDQNQNHTHLKSNPKFRKIDLKKAGDLQSKTDMDYMFDIYAFACLFLCQQLV